MTPGGEPDDRREALGEGHCTGVAGGARGPGPQGGKGWALQVPLSGSGQGLRGWATGGGREIRLNGGKKRRSAKGRDGSPTGVVGAREPAFWEIRQCMSGGARHHAWSTGGGGGRGTAGGV